MAEGATSDQPQKPIESLQGGEGEASQDAVGDATEPAKAWASMTASEKAKHAANVRWSRERKRRAGESDDSEPASRVVLTTTPIEVGKIMAALQNEAKKGVATAARELRNWLAEYPPTDTTLRAEELPVERRRAVLARLNAEIEAEEAA